MLVEPLRGQLGDIQEDLENMELAVPVREKAMTDEDRELFQQDRGSTGLYTGRHGSETRRGDIDDPDAPGRAFRANES